MYISLLGPSSSLPSSLLILFTHSAFSLCFFGCHIFIQTRSVSFTSSCWYVFVSLLPIVDIIFFRCFGKSCFVCIVLPFVDISLIFLLWPVFSGLFHQVVVIFSFVVCSFFPAYFSASLFLPFWLVFVFFYLRFRSNFTSWFWLFLHVFWGIPIFSQTNFEPASITLFNSVILFVGM